MGELLQLENLTFSSIWNALVVLIVLALLFFGIYKGIIMIRDDREKQKDKKQLNKKDITDEIADKVMDKLTPQIDEKFKEFSDSFDEKFKDIDDKLKSDKEDIKAHTSKLNDHEDRVSRLEGGDRSLCQGVLALLENASLTKQTHAMQNYILTGRYEPKDWETQ